MEKLKALLKEFVMSNRVKSLLWRSGAFLTVWLVDLLLKNLGGLGLAPWMIVPSGLVLGEISKALNNFLAGKSA